MPGYIVYCRNMNEKFIELWLGFIWTVIYIWLWNRQSRDESNFRPISVFFHSPFDVWSLLQWKKKYERMVCRSVNARIICELKWLNVLALLSELNFFFHFTTHLIRQKNVDILLEIDFFFHERTPSITVKFFHEKVT